MAIKKILYKIKPPCPKCPYTLGQVHTFTNPCSECKENGYWMYERLLRETGIYGETGYVAGKENIGRR